MAKLKPQDFTGLAGKDILVSALPEQIIAAIRKRKDLSMDLSAYLVKLTQYCAAPNDAIKKDLKKLYAKIPAQDKAAIKKDFSELLAAIIVKNSAKALRDKLKLTFTSQSKLFIPTAGNFPLVDFMVKSANNVDNYSVKIMGKTTNTVKAQDVLATVSDQLKRKRSKETKILKCIAENDAKLGPILALESVIDEMSGVKSGKMRSKFAELVRNKSINNDELAKSPEDWWAFFEPVIDNYYAKGKQTLAKAWKRGYHYDALTVLAQYAVADHTKDMNWSDFVDEIQTKVNYFKFDLSNDGTYLSEVVNGLSERKPNQKFRLRAKSRIKESAPSSRSGQDKLGIQP